MACRRGYAPACEGWVGSQNGHRVCRPLRNTGTKVLASSFGFSSHTRSSPAGVVLRPLIASMATLVLNSGLWVRRLRICGSPIQGRGSASQVNDGPCPEKPDHLSGGLGVFRRQGHPLNTCVAITQPALHSSRLRSSLKAFKRASIIGINFDGHGWPCSSG